MYIDHHLMFLYSDFRRSEFILGFLSERMSTMFEAY